MKYLLSMLAVCAGIAGEPPRTDAGFAWSMAERAVAAGPRHSGSEGALRSALWMERELKRYPRFSTRIVEFTEKTPAGEVTFRNLVAEIPGRSAKFAVVGAHYDTKYLPEVSPEFIGANDGGSGVAALLAMIRAIDRMKEPPPLGIRFVFFDGEECRVRYGRDDGLHGSRREAQLLEEAGRLRDCCAMILLDMVGDRELSITFPKNSDPELKQLALEEAEKQGKRSRFTDYPGNILDDDLPFQARGIPALNFIDFNYGPDNGWWHTSADTLDKLSSQSLKTVADVALALIWRLGGESDGDPG